MPPATIAKAILFGALLGLTSTPAGAKTHTVSAGDSLWALARKYGVSITAIQSANEMGNAEKIRTGQKLMIPVDKGTTKAAKSKPRKAPARDSHPLSKKNSVESKPLKSKSGASPKASTAPRREKPKTSGKPQRSAGRRDTSAKGNKNHTKTPTVMTAPESLDLKPVTSKARADAERLYAKGSTAQEPNTMADKAPDWVLSQPADWTQGEKTNASRRGVFPCNAPDPGFGAYDKWTQIAPTAHLLAPKSSTLGPNGSFNVVFHFHGREPIRKEWVRSMKHAVLIAVDMGIDSEAYALPFKDPRTFRQVLRAAEQEMARRNGRSATRVHRVALSAWSAGYGAVDVLLRQPFAADVVDAVILLDGLHSGYSEHSLESHRLRPFVEFAKRATADNRFMFVSHSSIRTTGYASTTETANYLVWKTGGALRSATARTGDPYGLELIRAYSKGSFHVRGFRGSGSGDHCAHLGLMRDILSIHLRPRWNTPNFTPDMPLGDAPEQQLAIDFGSGRAQGFDRVVLAPTSAFGLEYEPTPRHRLTPRRAAWIRAPKQNGPSAPGAQPLAARDRR